MCDSTSVLMATNPLCIGDIATTTKLVVVWIHLLSYQQGHLDASNIRELQCYNACDFQLTKVAQLNGQEDDADHCTEEHHAQIHAEVKDLKQTRLRKAQHHNAAKLRQCDASQDLHTDTTVLQAVLFVTSESSG